MIPKHRIPTHPGEILLEEFLKPLGITQRAFAKHIGITSARLSEIIKGKRGVSAETALLLSKALGPSPQFWMNLQANYDLALAQKAAKKRIAKLSAIMPAHA